MGGCPRSKRPVVGQVPPEIDQFVDVLPPSTRYRNITSENLGSGSGVNNKGRAGRDGGGPRNRQPLIHAELAVAHSQGSADHRSADQTHERRRGGGVLNLDIVEGRIRTDGLSS